MRRSGDRVPRRQGDHTNASARNCTLFSKSPWVCPVWEPLTPLRKCRSKSHQAMVRPLIRRKLPATVAELGTRRSRIAAKPRLPQTATAIGDVGIRLERNDFQHRQLSDSDLFHDRCNARQRDIAAPQRIVLVTLPGGIGKMNQAQAVADTPQSVGGG